MTAVLILIFILGYTAITLEHVFRIDKLIPALGMMALSWTIISLGASHITQWHSVYSGTVEVQSLQYMAPTLRLQTINDTLLHHFGKTTEILIFLMGAMAIVEMIDHFHGFSIFQHLIKTQNKSTLLWIIALLAFLLSAIIDNLTATIVLIAILRKIITDKKERVWFAAFVVMAANAGGAWSPIGDVTTTMLWMASKVSTIKLIQYVFLPSILNVLIPLIIATFLPVFKGKISRVPNTEKPSFKGNFMLVSGLALIVFVPVFKLITHLPPYVGMMFSLAIFALIAEILTQRTVTFTQIEAKTNIHEHESPTLKALSKIEMPSILFFLGILMTVAALESIGFIHHFGEWIGMLMPEKVFVSLLGIFSSVVDNVPLVAASIGMFPHTMDHEVWHFIAYTTGTGGSILIIGSAAGVVAMGMENISFGWYLRHIAPLALAGYVGGVLCFLLI
jgi:Na+/H+ antiporter NhaD/arsenite permease-like protein